MQVKIYKEDSKEPFRRGEFLAEANIQNVKGLSNKAKVNSQIWHLTDTLKAIHKCSLVVQIIEGA
jgi:protein involved in sex pheromone biosynthesis